MKYLLIASAAILFGSGAAAAQDNTNVIRVRVGLGAQLQPDFIGADGTGVTPLFHVNTARGADPFRFSAPDDGPGVAVLSANGFSFGPSINLQGRRKESDVGAAVGNVGRTLELGGFVQYDVSPTIRLRGKLLKGLGGHDGVVGSIGADRIWRDGDRYVFSIGPRVLFSNARYQRAYFGVSPAASLATGLPAYRPGGGIHALALESGASYQFSSRWGLFGYGRYERLVGHAARSPIIREFGSRNQLSAGVGLNYIFTIKQPAAVRR
ncbi:MAG TPA: MipA/OmpV family protein [Sphingomicrobium sp.]|nr:MipA/OmpV family protein [Sphingomicrobium sp.]